jgi:hypothetical protein
VWRAKALVGRLRGLAKVPAPFYAVVAGALVERGFEVDVGAFDARLAAVQRTIAGAPLDEAELADIHAAREAAALLVVAWLDEQRARLAGFDETERTILGLGDAEPPAGFEPPIGELARFEVGAKA